MTMTKLLFGAFCGYLIFGMALSGARAADCDGAITADDALKGEDARYAAQASSDFDAMGRLYGDDLIYVHSTGVVDSKASYIERQRSGLHYRVMKPSDVKVRVFGCLAIITGRGDYEVTQDGKDSSPHLLFTAVWAKRGPDVQFVSWESTPIPKP
jgi:ketosteroid isomerase-like protein